MRTHRRLLSPGASDTVRTPVHEQRSHVRILLVSDLHYALPQYDWVVGAADDVDLIVMAGDQLDISSDVALSTQVFVVCSYVAMLQERTKVIVSSGNHDLTGPDEHGENAALWMRQLADAGVPTDGDSVELDDTLVTVCPWWDGPVGRERVAEQLRRDAARRPARWIWVYHWPPVDSTTSWTGSRHYGDADLLSWIEEFSPDMVLAGHVHGPPFKPTGSWIDRVGRTWVFNPGNQRGPVPTRIEIDLADSTAAWLSQIGIEQADLTADSAPTRTVF
jgi:Icc-related predicted phosphoesterase